jgi:hypothetical protein
MREICWSSHLQRGSYKWFPTISLNLLSGMKNGDTVSEDPGAPVETFEGGIFEDWEGLLSVNGTIEGCLRLESEQRKEPLEFVLFEESGYDSCVEDD